MVIGHGRRRESGRRDRRSSTAWLGAVGVWPVGILAARPDVGPVLLWVGVLVVAVVLLGVVLMALRRRILGGDEPGQGEAIESLRRMHERGAISAREYRAIRSSMIEHLGGAGSAKPIDPVPSPAGREEGVGQGPRRSPRPASRRTADPGFDLTGEPLPDRGPDFEPERGTNRGDSGAS